MLHRSMETKIKANSEIISQVFGNLETLEKLVEAKDKRIDALD